MTHTCWWRGFLALLLLLAFPVLVPWWYLTGTHPRIGNARGDSVAVAGMLFAVYVAVVAALVTHGALHTLLLLFAGISFLLSLATAFTVRRA